jgi:hypothetical protein
MYIYITAFPHTHIYMQICKYAYTHTHTHTHTHIHANMRTCIHTHIHTAADVKAAPAPSEVAALSSDLLAAIQTIYTALDENLSGFFTTHWVDESGAAGPCVECVSVYGVGCIVCACVSGVHCSPCL